MTETGNWITTSRVSILETLGKVTADPPKLPSKSTVGFFEGIFFRTRTFWRHHPYLTIIIVVFVLSSLLYLSRGGLFIRRVTGRLESWNSDRKGGFFNLDEKNSNGLNGLLGGNAGNGKAD